MRFNLINNVIVLLFITFQVCYIYPLHRSHGNNNNNKANYDIDETDETATANNNHIKIKQYNRLIISFLNDYSSRITTIDSDRDLYFLKGNEIDKTISCRLIPDVYT